MTPNVAFYQQCAVPYFGIMNLAAYLKHAGLKSEVIIESLEKNPIEKLKEMNPPLIGISVLSIEHDWLIKTTLAMRRAMPKVKIIVGGIHAIFYIEEILSETAADFVCHSEGEMVLLNLINELNKTVPRWDSLPGLAYKDDLEVIRINERAPLVPFDNGIVEDRGIYYDRYPKLARAAVHRFLSSRGCPFRCSFCYNSKIQDLFKGKGNYVRKKSVKNFIGEIISQCTKYSIKLIFFADDLFTFDEKWLKEFLEIYKIEVGIPFICNTRADFINENIACMLAEAGCRTVSFGIETGNYYIRKEILKKDITDEQIIKCANLLTNNGIKIQTLNMFCLPGETLDDAYKTVELNIKAKANFAFSGLFIPFPKTELTDYCIEKRLLNHDYSLRDLPHSFLSGSVLRLPDKDVIINIHRLIYFFVRYPFFHRICGRLVKFSFFNIIFNLIFIFGTILRYNKIRGIGLLTAIRYPRRLGKSFYDSCSRISRIR